MFQQVLGQVGLGHGIDTRILPMFRKSRDIWDSRKYHRKQKW